MEVGGGAGREGRVEGHLDGNGPREVHLVGGVVAGRVGGQRQDAADPAVDRGREGVDRDGGWVPEAGGVDLVGTIDAWAAQARPLVAMDPRKEITDAEFEATVVTERDVAAGRVADLRAQLAR